MRKLKLLERNRCSKFNKNNIRKNNHNANFKKLKNLRKKKLKKLKKKKQNNELFSKMKKVMILSFLNKVKTKGE